MAIILRLDKGSELTFAEVDGNFSSLFYSGSLNGTNLEFYTYNNVLSQSFDLSNIPGFGGVGVEYDGGNVVTAANIINFTGTGVTVTANGNTANVDISGGGGSSTYTNLTPTPINFPSDADPNIPADTTFQDKTFTEMMNMMLYPTLYPTLTNPSLQSVNLSPSGYQEIGLVIGIGGLTLSNNFNRGTINPAYTTSGFRSGLPNTYNYTSPGGELPTSIVTSATTGVSNATTSTYTVTPGVQSFTVSVNYDEGPQPLNSIGGDYDSPLAAGNNPPGSTSKSITGVYPVFATTSTISTLTQQSLQSMSSLIQVSMVTEAGSTDKQIIEIPDAFNTISGLQQFNTLSSTWDTILLSSFTPSTPTTRTIQGNTVNYNRYTHNGAIIGARQLRFLV